MLNVELSAVPLHVVPPLVPMNREQVPLQVDAGIGKCKPWLLPPCCLHAMHATCRAAILSGMFLMHARLSGALPALHTIEE